MPVEIEHKAYWTVKQCNLDLKGAGVEHKLQLEELECFRLKAYKNLRSKWDGPFKMVNVRPYGVVEVAHPFNETTFKVNGHKVKPYRTQPFNKEVEVFLLEDAPKDNQ
ncbi:uncharacterized protein LOC110274862 [Arachis duranensis]|uniref:Uncharacterized protein LOC110274862 n=1 Tax=Arachis duranensis TaxID=130453 RepID=A0A6P5MMV8_ARADU|nr:uncharacterized protein LOC110274862 [Arachis duranensis]XP_025611985.1 uncharacterized protein LOC112705364 [Arachis hypogaea]